MTSVEVAKLRVAILGNCQISGLRAAALGLLPAAEIMSWHVGVHPKHSDDELLALLPSYDVIISQLSDWDTHIPLRISNLRRLGLPVTYLPGLIFTGFHPDNTYLTGPEGLIKGPAADYHSVIVASAYVMDVPERRVANLFNSYVFAELGYFDAFEAAKAALFANFDQEGFDLRSLFDLWMQQIGQFMYTINHPHIFVLTTLCRLALAKAGILDPAVTLPAQVDDYLSKQYIWPTYPALAHKLGIPGSTTFQQKISDLAEGKSRNMNLTEFVSNCFQFYGNIERDSLRVGNVAVACERLSSVIS